MALALYVPSKAQIWFVRVKLKVKVFAGRIRYHFRTIKVQLEANIILPRHTSVTPHIGGNFSLHLKST